MAGPTVPTLRNQEVDPRAMRTPNVSADAFGAPQGRAMVSVGRGLQDVGDAALNIQAAEAQKDQATNVTAAMAKAQETLRPTLYDPDKGIFNRQGSAAFTADADFKTGAEAAKKAAYAYLHTPEERETFDRMWMKTTSAQADNVAEYVGKQRVKYRDDTQTAILTNAAADATNGYTNQKVIDVSVDTATRAVAAANHGAPPEVIKAKTAAAKSAIYMAVIARMADDNPLQAQAYYEAHKGDINGGDHIKINNMLDAPLKRARLNSNFQRIVGVSAGANQLYAALQPVENASRKVDAISPKGAVGLAQVMPATAREVSESTDGALKGMTDAQVTQYIIDNPEAGERYGKIYLQRQLERYHGDPEAALVAYNAGPGVADKWLNSGRDVNVLPEETRNYIQKAMGNLRGSNFGGAPLPTTGNSAPLEIATKYLGVNERDNANVIAQFIQTAGGQSLDPQQTAWCAAFVNAALHASGQEGTGSNLAKSFLGYGRAVDNPNVGDLVVSSRGDPNGMYGHVGFLVGEKRGADGKMVYLVLGGNAGANGAVGVSEISADKVLGFREVTDTKGQLPAGAILPNPTGEAMNYSGFDLDQALAQVDLIAETPEEAYTLRNRVMAEATRRNRLAKQDASDLLAQATQAVWSGADPNDLTAEQVAILGTDKVNGLFSLAAKRDQDGAVTMTRDGWSSFNAFMQLPDSEARNYDVMSHYDQWDREHMDKAISRQADLRKDDDASRVKIDGLRTRQEIVSNAAAAAGFPSNKDPEAFGLFSKRVDDGIVAFQAENKRAPRADEIQKIVDQLMIRNHGSWAQAHGITNGDRLFAATPEELKDFVAAADYSQVPDQDKNFIGKRFSTAAGREPSEQEVVDLFNAGVVGAYGGKVLPPSSKRAEFVSGLRKSMGLRPTDELPDAVIADYWTRYAMRFTRGPGE